jgi:ankyrin repeat protein
MRIRNTIAMSLWFKFILFVMCGGVLYVHYALSVDYFNSTLSADQQLQAVGAALDVDARNDLGLTGLMFAAIYGEKELVRALIQRGALLNLVSPDEQQTALHYATNNLRAKESADVGHQLIDAYANTRMTNNLGNTPLHLVVSTDVLEDRQNMVDALMKNGANINAQNNQGDTLLHLAVNLQAYNWLTPLLEKYGSIMNRSLKNKKGLTPRQYAEQLGFGDMIKKLLINMPKIKKQ